MVTWSQHQPTPKFARPQHLRVFPGLDWRQPRSRPVRYNVSLRSLLRVLVPLIDRRPNTHQPPQDTFSCVPTRLSYPGLIIRTFNVVLIDQTIFSLRLHSVPHTSPFETFRAQSHTNSSRFSYSPRMRSRKPGEVTDQCYTLGLLSRHDESPKQN